MLLTPTLVQERCLTLIYLIQMALGYPATTGMHSSESLWPRIGMIAAPPDVRRRTFLFVASLYVG